MNIQLFDYELPKNLISQKPIVPRDHCKLLVYNKETKTIKHKKFYDIVDELDKNSVLVLNDTKVYPARLYGKKLTGGKIEIFLLGTTNNKFSLDNLSNSWNILVNKKVKDKEEIKFYLKNKVVLSGIIVNKGQDTDLKIEFNTKGRNLMHKIWQLGQIPLPPYIKNYNKHKGKYYQTIYAKHFGSCAAPTAGFHFTKNLLNKIIKKGIKIEYITLNVGIGTFKPIKTQNIEQHHMHKEYFEVSKTTAKHLNTYRQQGKKIVAVGTTCVRVLETIVKDNQFVSGAGFTDIFIYPGYNFKGVDQFITNFHLPRSTPLMMVAAFVGLPEETLRIYTEAICKKYKFYSFGDAMFIK